MKQNTLETFFDFNDFLPTLLITDNNESKELFKSCAKKHNSNIMFHDAENIENNTLIISRHEENNKYKNCFICVSSLSQKNVDFLIRNGFDMIFLKIEDLNLLQFQENINYQSSDFRPLFSHYFLQNDLRNNDCICLKIGCKYPILTSFSIDKL